MTAALVLTTSIAVAFFLGRGLEPWRPRDVRWLGLAVLAAILAPVFIYMVLAGCWALRFLAEQTAHVR